MPAYATAGIKVVTIPPVVFDWVVTFNVVPVTALVKTIGTIVAGNVGLKLSGTVVVEAVLTIVTLLLGGDVVSALAGVDEVVSFVVAATLFVLLSVLVLADGVSDLASCLAVCAVPPALPVPA